MNFSIITLSSFDKELKRLNKKYPSLKSDYSKLLDNLEANPKSGLPIGKIVTKSDCKLPAKAKEKAAERG